MCVAFRIGFFSLSRCNEHLVCIFIYAMFIMRSLSLSFMLTFYISGQDFVASLFVNRAFCISSRDNVNNMQRFGYYKRAQARAHALHLHRFQLKMHAKIFIHSIESLVGKYVYRFFKPLSLGLCLGHFIENKRKCAPYSVILHTETSYRETASFIFYRIQILCI